MGGGSPGWGIGGGADGADLWICWGSSPMSLAIAAGSSPEFFSVFGCGPAFTTTGARLVTGIGGGVVAAAIAPGGPGTLLTMMMFALTAVAIATLPW